MDVRAEWSASGLVVTIADDGPGFRAEVMDNIGEPYVTTRPTTETADGMLDEDSTGLGLGFFIAKTLLEALRRHCQPRQPQRRPDGGHRHRELAARLYSHPVTKPSRAS
ncbi:MAG: ATP-binding protein [Hyphomicrobium sp.]|nr:ATP-binding protein [Hyphomicrobium sp.]